MDKRDPEYLHLIAWCQQVWLKSIALMLAILTVALGGSLLLIIIWGVRWLLTAIGWGE